MLREATENTNTICSTCDMKLNFIHPLSIWFALLNFLPWWCECDQHSAFLLYKYAVDGDYMNSSSAALTPLCGFHQHNAQTWFHAVWTDTVPPVLSVSGSVFQLPFMSYSSFPLHNLPHSIWTELRFSNLTGWCWKKITRPALTGWQTLLDSLFVHLSYALISVSCPEALLIWVQTHLGAVCLRPHGSLFVGVLGCLNRKWPLLKLTSRYLDWQRLFVGKGALGTTSCICFCT